MSAKKLTARKRVSVRRRESRLAPTICSACGVEWTEHKGIIPTCSALMTAMTTLQQIAETPRNRGARRNAASTVAFLKSQLASVGSCKDCSEPWTQCTCNERQPNAGGQARESDERCPAPTGSANGRKK